MNGVVTFWGCGTGPLRALRPDVRILSGVMLGISCLLIPLHNNINLFLLLMIAGSWCLLAAMPVRMVVRIIIASIILFLPFVLLAPWMTIDPASQTPTADRLALAGAIALRSTALLFIALSTIAILPVQEFHRGLLHLPLPKLMAMLILQILNQLMLLIAETERIIGVLRLRSGTGIRSMSVLFSFPVVWMVRLLFRAERTAAAMTIRQYGLGTLSVKRNIPWSIADTSAIIGIGLLVFLSLFLRLEYLL